MHFEKMKAPGDCSLVVFFHCTFSSKNTCIFHSIIRLTSRKIILTIWETRGVQSFVCSISLLSPSFELGWNWVKMSLIFQGFLSILWYLNQNRLCFKTVRIGHWLPPSQAAVCGSVLVLNAAAQWWGPQNFDWCAPIGWTFFWYLKNKKKFFCWINFLKEYHRLPKPHKWRVKVSWFGVANFCDEQSASAWVSHSSEAAVF